MVIQRKKREMDERPCLAFARLDLDNEHEVARFMYKLFEGRYPEELFPIVFVPEIDPENLYNTFFKSPTERMAMLMWEALIGRPLRDPPWLDITISLHPMMALCKEHSHKLKEIQARLRDVLKDHVQRKNSKDVTGAWEFERWLLSDQEREFVNQQLKKVHPQIVAIPSPSTSEFSEFLGDHDWEEVLLVPDDFEAALYADLAEFFRTDGDITTCGVCGYFIEASGQQQARRRKDQPIYHPNCHRDKKRSYLKAYREEKIRSDPDFREKERQRARNYYRKKVTGEK